MSTSRGRSLGLVCALWALVSLGLAGEGKVYGTAPEAPGKALTVGELLAHPERYVDQRVKVQGRVTDVCPKAGCWIDISDGERTLRFKVQDYQMVFEVDTKGQGVIAEGVFTRTELSRDDAERYARHIAEEKGEDFDPATITGPMTVYRIDGTGAVLSD